MPCVIKCEKVACESSEQSNYEDLKQFCEIEYFIRERNKPTLEDLNAEHLYTLPLPALLHILIPPYVPSAWSTS